jgi:hypothetical protein
MLSNAIDGQLAILDMTSVYEETRSGGNEVTEGTIVMFDIVSSETGQREAKPPLAKPSLSDFAQQVSMSSLIIKYF